MKATVIVKFQDKISREHHFVGETLDVDKNRLNELIAAGVVTAEMKKEVKEEEAEITEYVAEPLKRRSNKR